MLRLAASGDTLGEEDEVAVGGLFGSGAVMRALREAEEFMGDDDEYEDDEEDDGRSKSLIVGVLLLLVGE